MAFIDVLVGVVKQGIIRGAAAGLGAPHAWRRSDRERDRARDGGLRRETRLAMLLPPRRTEESRGQARHSPARRGEEVYAVGEHPSLGCWDPAQAVKLRHSPGEGVWLSAPVSVPAGVSIQYKYLLFCEGRFERWEAFDGNRTIGAATSRAGSRHSLVPPDDELDVLPAPPEPHWSAGASTPPPTPAGLAEADGTTGVSGQLSALDVGEGGSVIVVSYILPLLITRERETASWAIDWNLDSVLARRASAGRAEGKRVLWIGCPGAETREEPLVRGPALMWLAGRCRVGVAVAEADRASLTEARPPPPPSSPSSTTPPPPPHPSAPLHRHLSTTRPSPSSSSRRRRRRPFAPPHLARANSCRLAVPPVSRLLSHTLSALLRSSTPTSAAPSSGPSSTTSSRRATQPHPLTTTTSSLQQEFTSLFATQN